MSSGVFNFNFLALVLSEVLRNSQIYTRAPYAPWTPRSGEFFCKQSEYFTISNCVFNFNILALVPPVSRSRHFWRWISQKGYEIQTEMLIGTYTRPTQQCYCEWLWVTLVDLAQYSMTRSVARSLCTSWASCFWDTTQIVKHWQCSKQLDSNLRGIHVIV